jgi:hypothetical protein
MAVPGGALIVRNYSRGRKPELAAELLLFKYQGQLERKGLSWAN